MLGTEIWELSCGASRARSSTAYIPDLRKSMRSVMGLFDWFRKRKPPTPPGDTGPSSVSPARPVPPRAAPPSHAVAPPQSPSPPPAPAPPRKKPRGPAELNLDLAQFAPLSD